MVTGLVSVHFPKAGGTATADLLLRHFGSTLLLDYADDPAEPASRRNLDPHGFAQRRAPIPEGVVAVHGHFHPAKYQALDDAVWVTVLRHPVDTLMSIYWFWSSYESDSPLHRYFRAERLDVLQLARLPLLQRLMSSTYFGGVDMSRFSVIGRHEDRQRSLQSIAALLGADLGLDEVRNRTPDQEGLQGMLADGILRRRLQDLLVEDVRFYEKWAYSAPSAHAI